MLRTGRKDLAAATLVLDALKGTMAVVLVRYVLCEPAYPEALRSIDAAPPLLAVAGKVEVLARPTIGIVGSRRA